MSVAIVNDRIAVSGTAGVEDAEALLSALLDHPEYKIDVSDLSQAHTAVIQLLHAAKRPLIGRPHNAFLRHFALAKLVEDPGN